MRHPLPDLVQLQVHAFLIDFQNVPLIDFVLDLLTLYFHYLVLGIEIIKLYFKGFGFILQNINISLIQRHIYYYLLIILIYLHQSALYLVYDQAFVLDQVLPKLFQLLVRFFFESQLII